MGFSGGVSTFTGLTDTPNTYAGQGGKLAKVKSGEDGMELGLLLTFADWYSGGLPASYPWTLIGSIPFTMTNDIPVFSPILKNEDGEYYVYVGSLGDTLLWKYNLTTGHWLQLASAGSILSISVSSLAISPNDAKLAATSGTRDRLQVYDIETDTWLTTAIAPNLDGETPDVLTCVWSDDDTIWVFVRKMSNPKNSKVYRYVVSTTTWTAFANSTGIISHYNGYCCAAIKTDKTAVYIGGVGAGEEYYLKYTIATDNYDVTGLAASAHYYRMADRNSNKLWYWATTANNFRYVDVDDESIHVDRFEDNPQRNKTTNIVIGVYEESVCIALHRTAEPFLWTYTGSGMWKLGERVLTDYNLAVFQKPADGYAILAVDKIHDYIIPIVLFTTLCLPAGTWEFFYPKDGDYTQLVISGSELK